MTNQEKEQKLLQLSAELNETQRELNASDYIDNQLIEGVDVDSKFNDTERYPQFEGDWRKYRAERRDKVREITREIKDLETVIPEEIEINLEIL